VHCGDFSGAGTTAEYDEFFDWLASHPHQHKVLVGGNHDALLQEFPDLVRRRLQKGISCYLCRRFPRRVSRCPERRNIPSNADDALAVIESDEAPAFANRFRSMSRVWIAAHVEECAHPN